MGRCFSLARPVSLKPFILSCSYHRARAGWQCGQGPAPARLLPGHGHALRDQGQLIRWATGWFMEVFSDGGTLSIPFLLVWAVNIDWSTLNFAVVQFSLGQIRLF